MGKALEYRGATKLKRWGNIAHTFTRIDRRIAITVKIGGPDSESNSHLHAVIATARRENVSKGNVEHTIENAMGKDRENYKRMNYEGYDPLSIAVSIETTTDNTIHTMANVRSVFNKLDGISGASNSLDFMLNWESVFIIIEKEGVNMNDLILELTDYGVEEEYGEDGDGTTLCSSPKSLIQIQKYLKESGFEVKGAELARVPDGERDPTPEQRATIDRMAERLEEDEDVQNVYTNMKPTEDEGEE